LQEYFAGIGCPCTKAELDRTSDIETSESGLGAGGVGAHAAIINVSAATRSTLFISHS
jgi:hypothetical protein